VARAKSGVKSPETKGDHPDSRWASLTWADLEHWAGSRTVTRGRSYQRQGRVKKLAVSEDEELLATVEGTHRYTTTVALGPGASLESSCTCPVGISCKHAVAVVADYLEAIAGGRDVPTASADDPRWEALEEDQGDFGDDDEWDDEGRATWDDDYEEYTAPPRSRNRGPVSEPRAKWDGPIENHIRAKPQGELADLVWSLVRRFPEVYEEFRERVALQEGDVESIRAEARREIRRVTSERGWRNPWTGEGNIPDFSKVRHRLERLLELGHADEVVSLGKELIRAGLRQVGESDDEGETAGALAGCFPVIFQAVMEARLSGPERLLFVIDIELADDYDLVGEAADVVFHANIPAEDWSAVADTLVDRLAKMPAPKGPIGDDFSRSYQRDQLTGWIATALKEAGRAEELRSLYESEARVTGSFERLVAFLIEQGDLDAAERWACEGIAAMSARYPGIGAGLRDRLCELARRHGQWDVVAAHAAFTFFNDHPSIASFDKLMEAARQAGVEKPVRAAALRFLETGEAPYQVITPPSESRAKAKSSASGKQRTTTTRPARPAAREPGRLMTDSAWPLPVPDDLLPLLDRTGQYDRAAGPHLEVLLEMAIAAKRPDEVLRWFDKMRSAASKRDHRDESIAWADRVAAVVGATHPERAIAIYRDALKGVLPHAQQSAYERAAGYLRKLRPLYQALGRSDEWDALVASIREEYRRRPRFMELLDDLDSLTIVESARSRRK
jgi:uncharacterized Zn finger protein